MRPTHPLAFHRSFAAPLVAVLAMCSTLAAENSTAEGKELVKL